MNFAPPASHPSAAPSAPAHPTPILSARGLVRTYGSDQTATRALDGVDLDIARADSLAVMGPSGCGKSTLLNLIAGLLRPTSGTLESDSRRMSYVFQEPRLFPWLTV
ncbi:MAG TPA: ATP-binding cassette domain-containing protein, partial [Brachybacterium paraconglomeratum]|nr:ATP-binding cassette domain-containing protein [Brachybacterium paraconglomeratum]